MPSQMPEDERTEPTGDDLDECPAWDGERTLPEWVESDSAAIGGYAP